MILKDISDLDKSFPITIIGTGPASATLALKLEENKIPCLLLEAGGFEKRDESDVFIPNNSSQDFYRGDKGEKSYLGELHEQRIRSFGGTSNLWTGLSRPLEEYVFEKWPIKKKDLQIYYKEAAEILELETNFDSDVFLSDQIKQVEYEYSRRKLYDKNKSKSNPVRWSEKYKERIIKSKYIHLSINSPVLRIIGNDKICNEILINKDNIEKRVPVKRLVVGCGGYENARLLLWSQKKSKTNFLQNLPIGNYFNVHPEWKTATGIARIDLLDKFFVKDIRNPVWGGTYILSPTKTFLKQNNISNIIVMIYKYDHHQKYKEFLREILCVAPEYAHKIAELAKKKITCSHVSMNTICEQEPLKENRITLSKNKFDNYGIPRIKMEFKLQNSVRKTMATCLEEVGRLFIDNDLGRIKIQDWLYDYSKDFSKDGVADNGCHHIGSTRMGNDSKISVVDMNLKVHNTENLFVAGSSVFTTGGVANPTLTITQLSLRLANHIKQII